MKVGLIGGSFNPPHQGHIYISDLSLKKLKLDQVWWVLTKKNPFKDENIYFSYEKRVNLCKNILKNSKNIYLKEFDDIYTEKLLKRLNKRYKNIEFVWIMGSDNINNFHKWKNFKDIIANNKIAIFSRETYLQNIRRLKIWNFFKINKPKLFFVKNKDISSTKIRNNEI